MLGPTKIERNRAPFDHLEVRSAETGALLGWISGIQAARVPAGEPLIFDTPDDAMVFEDEIGVEEITMATQVATDVFSQVFTDFRSHLALDVIHRQVPSYALRTVDANTDSVRYKWTAAVVDRAEHADLFEFDNFVPYGEDLPRLLLNEESEFHRDANLYVKAAPAPAFAPARAVNAAQIASNAITASKLASSGTTDTAAAYNQAASSFAKAAQGFGVAASQVSEQLKGLLTSKELSAMSRLSGFKVGANSL